MIQGIITSIMQVFGAIWWVMLLVILFIVSLDIWHYHTQSKHINNIKWVLLEIKIPKEDIKSPKVMEQFFSSLCAVEEWISMEMASSKEGIKFYIRTPQFFRNLVEAAFFSQYPEAEIEEVEDYIKEMPENLPDDTYDIFGADYILARENAYPIKTYTYFMREGVKEEEQTDPIATIAEVMSNLKSDERIWIQILIKPAGDDWKKEAGSVVNEVTGRKSPPKPGVLDPIFLFIKNLIMAPVTVPVWDEKKEEKQGASSKSLTPGEREIVGSVENKISKTGYETLLRFIYIDSKDSFTKSNAVAVIGAISQFNTLNLNAFRPASTITSSSKLLFKKSVLLAKKKSIFKMYRERAFYRNQFFPIEGVIVKPPILNVEELATIYHPPMPSVIAAGLRRVEAKKGAPPAGLPIK